MYIQHRILALKEERLFSPVLAKELLDPELIREHYTQYPASNKYLRTLVTLAEYDIQAILCTLDANPSFTTGADGKKVTADQYIRYIIEFGLSAGLQNKDLATFIIKTVQLAKQDTAEVFKYIFSDNAEKKQLIVNSLKAYTLEGAKATEFLHTIIGLCTARGIKTSTLLGESQVGAKNASLWQFLSDCQRTGATYEQALGLLKAIIAQATPANINSLMGKAITQLESGEATALKLIRTIPTLAKAKEQTLMALVDSYVTDKNLQALLNNCITTLFNVDLHSTQKERKAEIKGFLDELFKDSPLSERGKLITALYSLIETKSTNNPTDALYLLQKISTNKTFALDFTGKTVEKQLSALAEQLASIEKQLPAEIVQLLHARYTTETTMTGILTNYYLAIAATDLNTLGLPGKYAAALLDLAKGHCGRSAILGQTVKLYLEKRYPDTPTISLWNILPAKRWQEDLHTLAQLFNSSALRELADKIQTTVMQYLQTGKLLEAVSLGHLFSITPYLKQLPIERPEMQIALFNIAKDLDIKPSKNMSIEKVESVSENTTKNIQKDIAQFIEKTIEQTITAEPLVQVLQSELQKEWQIEFSPELTADNELTDLKGTGTAQELDELFTATITLMEQQAHQEQNTLLLKELRTQLFTLETKLQSKDPRTIKQLQSLKALVLIIATLRLPSVLKNMLQTLKTTQDSPMLATELPDVYNRVIEKVTAEHLPGNILVSMANSLEQNLMPLINSTIPQLQLVAELPPRKIQTIEQFLHSTVISIVLAQTPAALPAVLRILNALSTAITGWDELVRTILQAKTAVTSQQLFFETMQLLLETHQEFRKAIEKQEIRAAQTSVESYIASLEQQAPAHKAQAKTTAALERLFSLYGIAPEQATALLKIIEKLHTDQTIDLSTLSPQLLAVLLVILPPQLREKLLKLLQKKNLSINEWLTKHLEKAEGVAPLLEKAIHALTDSAAA